MKIYQRTALAAALLAALAGQGQSSEIGHESLWQLDRLGAHAPPDLASQLQTYRFAATDQDGVFFDDHTADHATPAPARPPACVCDTPCLGSCPASATRKRSGFIDLNYYWDNREFNVMTINAGAKLPHDFEYFQFLNLFGNMQQPSSLMDMSDFFTEINLRRPVAKDNPYLKHLDFTLQFADGSGPPEVGRLGIRWRLQDTPGPVGDFFRDVLKLQYSVNFHLLESDGAGWQIEHVYRRVFLDGRIYASAFCDHNIDGLSGSSTWVTEHQVGVRLIDQLYVVGEYRYTSFAPPGLRAGWGFGLEYVIRFN